MVIRGDSTTKMDFNSYIKCFSYNTGPFINVPTVRLAGSDEILPAKLPILHRYLPPSVSLSPVIVSVSVLLP